MRHSIVPAQITTVEDKVVGNLTLSQLILLTVPVFIGGLLFAVFPPSFNLSVFKVCLVTIVALVFGIVSVRVKGKILLVWAVTIVRYNMRPRYSVYDKNDMYLRDVENHIEFDSGQEAVEAAEATKVDIPELNVVDMVAVQSIIDNPKANFHIRKTRRGGLSVRVTEVK